MNGSSNFDKIKMQLKARLRVPTLLKSKRLNLEFERNYGSSPPNGVNLSSYSQSKMNKSYINSFYKYSFKTYLLKKLLSNMTIKELYHEEQECSKRCKEVVSEIENKKSLFELQNLPLITAKKKFIKKKIIIKTIQKPKPFKKLIFKKNTIHDYINIPYLSSSSNKVTSYIESTKEKNLSTSKSNLELEPIILFNYKKNYSIIKGGGIRYNNSIFRYKNMNDLLHF